MKTFDTLLLLLCGCFWTVMAAGAALGWEVPEGITVVALIGSAIWTFDTAISRWRRG